MDTLLISVAEVARRLGVSVYTIRRLIAAGHVHGVNVGGRVLISSAEVDRIVSHGVGEARRRRPKMSRGTSLSN